MMRLTLHGGFLLTGADGSEIQLSSKKSRAMLACLALAPGQSLSREQIMALLWSDRAEPQARASLRQVLTGLRKTLGDDAMACVRISDEVISLDARYIMLDNTDTDAELLSGLHIADAAFEDWLRDERSRQSGDAAKGTPAGPIAAREEPTVAVLPFTNLSGDPEQEYFSDGLTEDLITELSRLSMLRVIGRNSSFAFKGTHVDTDDVRRTLGADFLVHGSVRRAQDRVRITVQLSDTESRVQVWASRYDRELADIFAVQDEVVSAIVSQLGHSLNDMATATAKQMPTQSLTAYDLLLRARSAWWQGNINQAFELTRRSVETDRDYAAAHAYFSLQHAYQFFSSTVGLTWDQIAERCRFHAEAALALDDKDPFVHAYASMAFGFSPLAAKDRGMKHIEIAVDLNPYDSELMLLYAWHLCFAGRPREALDLLARASALNPLGDFMISECYADIYYMTGDYSNALDSYRDQPTAPPQVQTVFAACHAQLGRDLEARALLRDLPDDFDAAAFARAQMTSCLRDEDRDNWCSGFRRAGIEI